jgi:hypothetical protein
VNSSFYLVKTERTMDIPTTADDQAVLPRFIFGVSGHLDLIAENLAELRQQIRTVFDRYRLAYPGAFYELLSPLAEGADRVAAEVALSCGIKLTVPLPMAQSEYERDFTTPGSLEAFRRFLAAADAHFEVRSETGSRLRADNYAAVGDYIVRRSHVLILLWDGRDNEKVGGTAWVKKRREEWIASSKASGNAPSVYGYVGTIHILTPRQANPEPSRIQIIGDLPPVPRS